MKTASLASGTGGKGLAGGLRYCLLAAGIALVQAGPQVGIATSVAPAPARNVQRLQQLLTAYPDHLASVEPNAIVWRDGTRMIFDDGRRLNDPEARLNQPSLLFQLEEAYPRGDAGVPPAWKADPGRIRYEPFFRKMYGATPSEVEKHLVSIRWLPHTANRALRVTRINGVDQHLQAVSEELEQLSPERRRFVERPSGGYHWRQVEGTRRTSAHAFGIAIDLDASASDYWRWVKTAPPPFARR